jgi:hypothetical protein
MRQLSQVRWLQVDLCIFFISFVDNLKKVVCIILMQRPEVLNLKKIFVPLTLFINMVCKSLSLLPPCDELYIHSITFVFDFVTSTRSS